MSSSPFDTLATPDDIRRFRPIAKNTDDGRITMYIEEVTKLTIIPAIGADTYNRIAGDKPSHELLLNGGFYADGTKHLSGLIAAISLLAYARFVRSQNINVTPFGVKEKLSIDSDEVSDRALVRHANEAESTGQFYLQQCVDYLSAGCQIPVGRRKYRIIGE